MDIVFTNMSNFKDIEQPEPASKLIPEWYKKMESYVNGKKEPGINGGTSGTIKKCMPVVDSIMAGYIIKTVSDIFVTTKDGSPYFEWASFDAITAHGESQVSLHPSKANSLTPKFMNPWGIKTPKGYSTLFVQPFHRESVFTIYPGIVDTDEYCAPVNFPFVLNDPNFQGLIPVGTPIAQVIPIKRDSWSMKLGSEKEVEKIKNIGLKLNTKFFDRYKTMFRQNKEYK